VAEKIAQKTGTIPITHTCGCLQVGEDFELTVRTIQGMAQNPNVGAVLVVGLGCEQTPTKQLVASITGKPCDLVIIQESGGSLRAIQDGIQKIEKLREDAAVAQKEEFDISALRVSLKCGGSDFTTALASNAAVGVTSDLLVEAGAGVFLTETTGFPGSEHILAKQAKNIEIAKQIYKIVDFYWDEMRTHFNRDITDGNPSPGNIAGGITTLTEKSIGTIKKGGSTPIQGVLRFADDVTDKTGLWIMDTPGHDVYSVSGPSGGGCHITLFTTGRGSPLGNPVMPVIKIVGNPETYQRMEENMDINAGTIMTGDKSIEEVGKEIFDMIVAVANGKQTKAEILEHWEFAIPRIGSTI
jgi:altronate dehydratase large subunit